MAEAEGTAERLNLTCFQLSREATGLGYCVPQAAPLVRTLLRVVGRVIIEAGGPGADPAVWANTETMALQWVREAILPLGYDVRPLPGSGRPELTDA